MSLEKSLYNLGMLYGLAERALPQIFGHADEINSASDAPMLSIPKIMKALTANKALTNPVDDDILELLDGVDVDTPEHPPEESKMNWWMGYYKTKPIEREKGIESARKRAGLTQTELAEKINTSQYSVSRWENKVVKPGADFLKKIAEACGCSIDDLV